MGEKKILSKDTYVAEKHKDNIITLPVFLRFDEGEFPLSDIKKESKRIKEYIGSVGVIAAGGVTIGEGIVRENNENVRVIMKILPKKHLADVLDKSRVCITCILDTFILPAHKVEELGHNSIIPVKDTIAGDPVSILVNGIKMADGELCIIGDRFGVRVIEIAGPETENLIQPFPGDEPEAYCYILAGKTVTTMNNVYTVGEGSIIQFDDPVSDLFPLYINGQPAFLVEIIAEGDNYSARIYDPDVFTHYLKKRTTAKYPKRST